MAAHLGATVEEIEGDDFVEIQAIAPTGHHWLSTLTRSVVANVSHEDADTVAGLWKIARAAICDDMADGIEPCSDSCDHDDDDDDDHDDDTNK